MKIKKITKSVLCILTVCALIFSLASCGAEKNVASEGLKEFNKISDEAIINNDNVNITESSDGTRINYSYTLPGKDGGPAIFLAAGADKKSKELIDVLISFVGTGRKDGKAIPDELKSNFTDLASTAMRAFTGLSESEAKAILDELGAYDTDFYNGKNSKTKTVGAYRYGLSSGIIMTGFTIRNTAFDTPDDTVPHNDNKPTESAAPQS